MKMTRDAWIWWLLMIVAVCGVLESHFDIVTLAFTFGPKAWQARIELTSILALAVAAYLRKSPLALDPQGDVAAAARGQQVSAITAATTLTVTGAPKS